MNKINLHIDHLVLRGFRRGDRHAIAAALQNELARIMKDPALTRNIVDGGNTAQLRLPNIELQEAARPDKIGSGVAQAFAQHYSGGSR